MLEKMKLKKISEFLLILLAVNMISSAFHIQSVQGTGEFEKILIFEDDFENGIAAWWNYILGTPTISQDIAHSGNCSYVTDEGFDSLAYIRYEDPSMIGEIEAWFYDNLALGDITYIVCTEWEPSGVFGVAVWNGGGDYDLYYAYRLGTSYYVSSRLRTIGWHRVNIIHEPEVAYILLDEELLVQIGENVAFRGITIGDNWTPGISSFAHFDDVKVWKYVQPPPVPEFPIGSAIYIAAIPLLCYLWLKKRQRTRQ